MQQLIAHLFGDYVFQTQWMAGNKTKRSLPCFVHAVFYTLPFVCITQSWKALLVIAVFHFVIDRWKVARYLIWLKEQLGSQQAPRWEWCRMTGYFDQEVARASTAVVDDVAELCDLHKDDSMNIPVWLRVWLLIITDNTMHLLTNYLAIAYL
jgi:hypothetical protein